MACGCSWRRCTLAEVSMDGWLGRGWWRVAQLCPTLGDPVDCSPPGSSVYGIPQARRLEWVAIPFSKGSSPPRDRTRVSYVSCIGR